ncbi:MAG: hypothetical protein R3D98_09835 [Candidatus Krumholzibacteriia bacterium]
MLRRLLLAIVLCLGLLQAAAARAQSTPEAIAAFDRFFGYVKAAVAGDLPRAEACWSAADLAAAGRLAIRYPGGAPKVDNDSPLWTYIDAIRDSTVTYRFGPATRLANGPFRDQLSIVLKVEGPGVQARKQYLFESDGRGGWLLARPERLLADLGPRTSGRYVTVYERRPGASWTLPPFLLANLDSAVTAMATSLAMSDAARSGLASGKLGYLLAAPEVVEQLAGGATAGVAILQSDLVATHHPFHTHELAHLVANAWLGEPPLYTLPLLQEGLAVHLGGRWGRDRRVMERIGRTTLESGFLSVDELLTRAGFQQQSADLTYAPAGVFVGFLLRDLGPDALRRAYLAGSGTLAEVDGWDEAEVRARLSAALEVSWPDLMARFAQDLRAPLTGGIEPAGELAFAVPPRELTDGGTIARRELLDDGRVLLTLTAPEAPVRAVILIGGDGTERAADPLLAEYLPGRTYCGESHLLVISADEAKLYDLRRQLLVALHSEGFWPSTAPRAYVRDGGRTVAMVLSGQLGLPAEGWTLVQEER